MLTATKTRRYECARCGRKRPAHQMVYSTHTRHHYCGPAAMDACDRRFQKAVTA